MRIKILELITSILYSIYRAEDKFGRGTGRMKLNRVKGELQTKAVKLRFLTLPTDSFSPEILSLLIRLIETIVLILHAIGVFAPNDRRVSEKEGGQDI